MLHRRVLFKRIVIVIVRCIVIVIVIVIEEALFKRVLEYGVWAPVFYGHLREQTGENGFHEYLQEYCFVLAKITEILRKPTGFYRRM